MGRIVKYTDLSSEEPGPRAIVADLEFQILDKAPTPDDRTGDAGWACSGSVRAGSCQPSHRWISY